jgi:hypothetical protein
VRSVLTSFHHGFDRHRAKQSPCRFPPGGLATTSSDQRTAIVQLCAPARLTNISLHDQQRAVVLLNELLKEREALRDGGPLPADEAFELFAFEQALKDNELSTEEIAEGQVGGGNDGGIDGVYTFLNGNLISEDSEVLDESFHPTTVGREPNLALVVVQAKQTASFAETPFEKLQATFGEILELAKPEEWLRELFSAEVVARVEIFRRAWHKLSTRHPQIAIRIVYASKGDTDDVNEKVRVRASRMREQITATIPKASATVEFVGARELVDLAGRAKSYALQLAYRENATGELYGAAARRAP